MAFPRFRPIASPTRSCGEQAWILGAVALLHLVVLALLLSYRITLPEGPPEPVIRMEAAPALRRPPVAGAAALSPITVPNPEPEVVTEEERRASERPTARRPAEAVVAEEILTPSVTANTLGAHGFDLMSPPTYAAPYLRNRLPAYPASARAAREQGVVVLRVLVNPLGRGQAAEIHRSSGHARLDAAARQAVLGWRYIPAERGRRPVLSWTLISIRFRANGTVLLDDDAGAWR